MGVCVCAGVILVYDICSRTSFENVQSWLREVDIYSTNAHVVKMLVGNKLDKHAERTVTKEEGKRFARANQMLYIECSAKSRLFIQQAFDELVQKIFDDPNNLPGAHDSLNLHGHGYGSGYCGGWCGA